MHSDKDSLAVDFRPATRYSRSHLQRFKCTDAIDSVLYGGPGAQVAQPEDRSFELRAQHIINTYKPSKKSVIERLGWVDDSLASVMLILTLEPGAAYELTVGAVALGWQGRGIADQMMRDAFREIGQRTTVTEVEVFGVIHRDNERSKKMADSAGMAYAGPDRQDPLLERWMRRFDPHLA